MKVRIDHDECIACGACYADCPEFFEENEDGMSIVLEAYRDGDPAAGLVPAEHEECVREAAESCPVECIHIEE